MSVLYQRSPRERSENPRAEVSQTNRIKAKRDRWGLKLDKQAFVLELMGKRRNMSGKKAELIDRQKQSQSAKPK